MLGAEGAHASRPHLVSFGKSLSRTMSVCFRAWDTPLSALQNTLDMICLGPDSCLAMFKVAVMFLCFTLQIILCYLISGNLFDWRSGCNGILRVVQDDSASLFMCHILSDPIIAYICSIGNRSRLAYIWLTKLKIEWVSGYLGIQLSHLALHHPERKKSRRSALISRSCYLREF